jgi:hypothetical protein
MLIVNPVPAVFVASNGAALATGAVLQVTLRRVPSSATGHTLISELAVTAVVLIVQVAPEALVAQEKAPAEADVQVTTEGLAEVPTPAQFVAVI